MPSHEPTTAPIGAVWLAIVCETGEEHTAPGPVPVIKVADNEWHGVEPSYSYFRAEDYMINHHTTLHEPTHDTEQQWAAQWRNGDYGWTTIGALPVPGDRLTNDKWTTEPIARARLAYLQQHQPQTRLIRRHITTEVIE